MGKTLKDGVRLFVTVAALLWLAAPASVTAQDLTVATRTPRFLMASRSPAPPVEIDVRTNQLLRRRVSLQVNAASLRRVLQMLSAQAGVKFLFDPDAVPAARSVTLRAEGITLAGALLEALIDTDLDVLLLPTGRQLALVKRVPGRPSLRAGAITGRVTDVKTGAALDRVDVLLEGTGWRKATDSSGSYAFADVGAGNYTLIARRLGYAKRSVAITVSEGRTDTVNIALEAKAVPLDELVTTATGRQRRRDIGNAITTIHADSVLQTAPIRSLTDLLEHRVPGLTVQHTSGAPGDPSRLRLRGLGSALRSNDPVVIVDGARVYAAQSEARSGNLTNSLNPVTLQHPIRDDDGNMIGTTTTPFPAAPAPSPLDQIDPNIIETIEVFKGPSAATLYGADAANGVIVITTKRGRPGPTRWNASLTRGRTTTPGQWPTGYYRFGRDAYLNTSRFCTLTDLTCRPDSLVQFQALNEPVVTILGRGQLTGLSLTTSGGSQTLQYSLTGSYNNEVGLMALPAFEVERYQTRFNREPPDWMRHPHHYKAWAVSSNVTARLNAVTDVTLSTSLTRSEQQRTALEQQLAPLMSTYVDLMNGIYYQPKISSPGNGGGRFILPPTSAPLSNYYTRLTASTITFTTTVRAQWRPLTWFSGSGQAGLNVEPRDDRLLLPAGLVAATDSGNVARGTGRSLVSTFDVQGTLRKALGRGLLFTTNVGANLTSRSTSDLLSAAGGLQPGTGSLTGATRIFASEQGSNTSVYGWYIEPGISGGRIALSTGLRLDGGNTYGTRVTTSGVGLPKLNGSWVISEEPWFPFNAIISSLRLRGAYGQAQVQPGSTDRLRLYSGTTGQPASQLLLNNLGNTELRPERSTEFEGGFDLDVLDNRVSVELTGYRKMQVDALMNVAVSPSVNGGGSQFINIGNIRNTGLEVTMGLTPVRSPAITWSAQFHYSRNNNILTKLGKGVAPNKAQGLVEGYPLYSRWARPILGFADQNEDGVLESQEIQIGDSLLYMGRLLPAYTTALFTNVALFGSAIGVTAGFSYDGGQTQVNQTARDNWVLARALVDPSAPPSEQASVLASIRQPNPTDYGLMQEISTFRFSSLSVNYHLPNRAARWVGAQRLSVAVQGSNLGLHSNYQGKDPNVNAWSPGEAVVDTGQLPQPRTWQVRVDVQY